jgi:hypothetical protein
MQNAYAWAYAYLYVNDRAHACVQYTCLCACLRLHISLPATRRPSPHKGAHVSREPIPPPEQTYPHSCLCMCVYACVCVCMYVCMYTRVHIHLYSFRCVCIFISMHTCIRVCTHGYTQVSIFSQTPRTRANCTCSCRLPETMSTSIVHMSYLHMWHPSPAKLLPSSQALGFISGPTLWLSPHTEKQKDVLQLLTLHFHPVCAYACVCVYVCVCVYMRATRFMFVCAHICMSVSLHVWTVW